MVPPDRDGQVDELWRREVQEHLGDRGVIDTPRAGDLIRVAHHRALDRRVDVMIDGEVLTLKCESVEVLPGSLDVMI